ncbi:cytochrome P450 71A1-like isoform X1 [Iris pallida]|uniref:Cytochrome P450 71A1-like isoform X1 n=1 Tax=Iris pallida TaxID=29817 RepID=A0AAX6HZL9_IRIPA|nr:cytochrome P450 71A1-like isoform X1 [Iris pallida]
MTSALSIAAFSSLFLVSLLFLFKRKKKAMLNLPPGPRPLPVIGNLHQVGELLHRSGIEFSKLYGPIVHLRLGSIPSIIVSSPALAKEVLKTQDLNFCDRPALLAFARYTYGGLDVGVAQYGDHWRNLRKLLVLELLSAKKLRDFQSLRQKETDLMMKHISKKAAGAGSPVNLSELVVFLIHTFVFRVTFGYKHGGGDGEEYGKRTRFHEVVEECNVMMGTAFLEDYFPGFGFAIDAVTGLRGRLERNAKELDDFFQKVIDEHMAAAETRAEGYEEDFVDIMIRLWREGNQHLSVKIIKGMLLDMLVAGTDTTAATIVWTMVELARHPLAMKKAQDEVRNLVGDKGVVEASDLARLQYLKLVVNESMRLHSQLLIPRQAISDCKVGGYDVCAKTTLYVNSWALARDPESWEKPEAFIPERFVQSSIDYKGTDFQFLPFGAGRRICPGINFGLSGVELTLANLLYAFNWELPPGMNTEDIDMGETSGSVTHKKVPLCLVARNK